jgi:hypothetical protein
MDHEDLAAVRPAYDLLRSKLADLDRARKRLQELIDGFEGLYPALAQEAPATVVETPEMVTEQPTMAEEVTPTENETTTAWDPQPVHDAVPLTDDYIPRGKQAVVMTMAEEPGRWFTAPDVLRAMDQHGWTPRSETPEQALRAVRTALLRAFKAGQIEHKPVDGRSLVYRFPPADEPAEVTPSLT